MLNALGYLSFANLNDYQQNLVKGTIDAATYYAVGDTRKSLSIRYLSQQESNNDDTETGLKHKQFNSKYYEYHLVPVLENMMLNPMINIDETKQGMNSTSTGEMVILAIDKPLINDLFDFYVESHPGIEIKEMFKVIEVIFLRTSAGLNMYRVMYETAPIKPERIYIEKSFFWFNDFRRFFPTKYIEFMKKIVKKEYLLNLKKYYRPEWSIVYDGSLSKEINLKLNKILLYIKYKDATNSGNFPLIILKGFDPSTIEEIVSDKEIGLDNPKVINFTKDDVWYEDPNYIFDPDIPYDWLNGKIKNDLAYCIWEIYNYYKPFIGRMKSENSNEINPNVFHEVKLNNMVTILKELK